MPDPFYSYSAGVTAPAVGALAITPNNGTDLAASIRAITIGGGGTVAFVSSRDGLQYTTGALPAGTYPLFARRILATGTSATNITGWI